MYVFLTASILLTGQLMNSHIHWHECLKVQLIGYYHLHLFTILNMQFECVIFCVFGIGRCNCSFFFRKKFWHLRTSHVQLSYLILDLIVWWGSRGFINDFRKKLNLPPIAYFSTYHGSISHLPTGYMWSPQLMPKPKGNFILFSFMVWALIN